MRDRNNENSAPFSLIAVVAAFLILATAEAQYRFYKRDVLVARLAELFNEYPGWRGLDAGNNLAEIFESHDGSWTLVLTLPSGLSRVIASGEASTRIELPPPGIDG